MPQGACRPLTCRFDARNSQDARDLAVLLSFLSRLNRLLCLEVCFLGTQRDPLDLDVKHMMRLPLPCVCVQRSASFLATSSLPFN